MNKTFILAIVAGTLMLGLTAFAYNNAAMIQSPYTYIAKNKSIPIKLKLTLLDMLRDLNDTYYDIKRRKISVQELPILNIYLTDGAVKKIENKRRAVLSHQPRPILITDENDWVKASIVTDDGVDRRKVRVRLRLKGDWADHLVTPHKLSFRIKVRGGDYIFGMKRFSIQRPATRQYHLEPMILDQMRNHGVLASRYFFVDVRINDYKIGVMALEEHFSKELLESQNRREGPILALDEDIIWRQRHLNLHVNKISLKDTGIVPTSFHYFPRDLRIKEFGSPKYRPGTTRTNHSIRGISLLRDFLDGKKNAVEVFDLKKFSQWWVLTNVWGGWHATYYPNLRFYFNPVTNLLEPIAFDNNPKPNEYKYLTGLAIQRSLGDEYFVSQITKDLNEYDDLIKTKAFASKFRETQDKMLTLLAFDGINPQPLTITTLRENINRFKDELAQRNNDFKKYSTKENLSDGLKNIVLLKLNAELHTHIRLFSFIEKNQVNLEIKNHTLHKIKIISVYYENRNGQKSPVNVKPFILLPYKKGNKRHIVERSFPMATNYPESDIYVEYKYLGKRYAHISDLQFRNHDTGLANSFFEDVGRISKKIIINYKNRVIRFPEGGYTIDRRYVLPKDWKLVLMAGADIKLVDGALLKIRGPLYALGRDDKPVNITIASDKVFKGIGAWGGLLVAQSDKRSRISHTQFQGDYASSNFTDRQDFFGLTGCVTFYESDVDITDSQFSKLQCEDALNIVRADFHMKRVLIQHSQFDGFDSDFSTGSISASTFTEIGNDGVDVSGTKLYMKNNIFNNIGDKAISVGEKSELEAVDLNINNASTGAASKDLSVAKLSGVDFKDISGSGLITYIKKQEYGPARIECEDCSFQRTNSNATCQFNSTIILNGETVRYSDFTHEKMIEAGYISKMDK